MNNASASSSHPQPNHAQQPFPSSDDGLTFSGEEAAVPASVDDGGDPEQERRRVRREQKIKFLSHLIRNFDIFTYCQLWILYYMDISLLKFLVRAVPHYIHLTPKPLLPPPLPPMPPSPPPSFALILLSNLLPFLLHIIYRPPSGSEAARGYLHGGIFIDFVGQEAPASKVKLVVLDLLVLGLQVVMMALVLEKRGLEPPRMLADGSSPAGQHHRALAQDHDAEERGVLLPPSPITETRETFPSPSSAGRLRVDQDRDPDVLEDTRSSVARTEYHPLDDFRAGQYVVANLHLMNIMRAEWTRYNDHAARTSGLGDAIGRRSARRDDGRDAVRGGNWGARLRFVAVLGRTGV